jgi:MFS family permease
MRLGTASFKIGAEIIKAAVPLLAFDFGGATAIGIMVAVYGLAQIVSSSWAGALARRWPEHKILAVSVAVMGAMSLGLLAAGTWLPAALFPAYAVVGAGLGMAETTRRSIPPHILGQDDVVLAKYNGSLHAFYEVAGVAASLAAFAIIGASAATGALLALAIPAPAMGLAAWLFWKVRHAHVPTPREDKAGNPLSRAKEAVSAYLSDLKQGAGTIFKTPWLRWLTLAMVLPQVVHRVFEDLLAPAYAKKILHDPSASPLIQGASNLGELLGALLLLKLAQRWQGPSRWVKLSAVGLLAAWALYFQAPLYGILAPLIVVFSMSWAASDQSLLTSIQSRLGEKERTRVLSVLFGTAVVLGTLSSLFLGGLLDGLSPKTAFLLVGISLTVLAGAVGGAGFFLKPNKKATP